MTVKDTMEKPRTAVVDVLPLTAAGNGLNLWGHVTPHALADVLGPGYFDACQEANGGGLYRHDRIVCTASAETGSPRNNESAQAGATADEHRPPLRADFGACLRG